MTRTTANGQAIHTIKISGKDYAPVAARVELAHDNGGFTMLPPEVFEVGGRTFYRAGIVYNEQTYYGTSEVKWNAKAGTADATAPMECAETSAVGRALGMAGIGLLDSIATADDMRHVATETRQPASKPAQAAAATPAPPSAPVDTSDVTLDDVPFEQPTQFDTGPLKVRAKAVGWDWKELQKQALANTKETNREKQFARILWFLETQETDAWLHNPEVNQRLEDLGHKAPDQKTKYLTVTHLDSLEDTLKHLREMCEKGTSSGRRAASLRDTEAIPTGAAS